MTDKVGERSTGLRPLLDGERADPSGSPARCAAAQRPVHGQQEVPVPDANAAGTSTRLGVGTTKNAINTSG
jgi:hypothetical protein